MAGNSVIVFVHGNPGNPQDIETLKSCFTHKNTMFHAVPRLKNGTNIAQLINDMESEIQAFQGKELTLIGYSWGCYLILKWLAQTSIKPKKIIFISPSFSIEHPISSVIYHLSRTPILGKFILKKIATKQSEEFLHRSFLPTTASPDYKQALMQSLNKAEVWKGAINYKYQQQNNPITDIKLHLNTSFMIIRGNEDQSISWHSQEGIVNALLEQGNSVEQHSIAGAGHALMWSHNEDLKKILQKNNEPTSTTQASSRIGYQAGKTAKNNVISYLLLNAERYAEKAALRWIKTEDIAVFQKNPDTTINTEEISYKDFSNNVERVARGLLKLGIQRGDRVILFLPMGMPMYTAMFAIQWIGAIAVFLDSWARRNHLGASAKCVEPKAMISHHQAFELVNNVPEFETLPLRIIAGHYPQEQNNSHYDARLEDLFLTEGEPLPLADVESEHTALITFTTGSSGTPKGANRTHRFLCAQHEALNEVIPYAEDDIDIPAFPIFSLHNLASGVSSLLPALDLAAPSEKDSFALAKQIKGMNISCTTLSPSMLNDLSGYCLQNKVELNSLRRVITGGAPISKDNVRDFKLIAPNAEIHVLYGSTEVEPMAHIEAQEMLALDENPDPEIIEEGVNVGHIANGLRYKFIHPIKTDIHLTEYSWKQLEVKDGEVGEFIVSGGHVCESYYNNSAAFYKTKIKETDGTIWHRTGDLARIDSNNYLWVVGRVHNMISRDEQYFFPVSAEIILKRCDFINKGAFLGLPDKNLGERTAIALEFKESYTNIETGINEIIRLMKKNNIPVDSLYAVDHIPMDPRHHSKVEYALLRENIISTNAKDLLCP